MGEFVSGEEDSEFNPLEDDVIPSPALKALFEQLMGH